jgi:hypothetical protein
VALISTARGAGVRFGVLEGLPEVNGGGASAATWADRTHTASRHWNVTAQPVSEFGSCNFVRSVSAFLGSGDSTKVVAQAANRHRFVSCPLVVQASTCCINLPPSSRNWCFARSPRLGR